MRLGMFALGVAVGLALAPASGRATLRRLRDRLAMAIDAALRIGITPASAQRDRV
jgi:hypothetical protein